MSPIRVEGSEAYQEAVKVNLLRICPSLGLTLDDDGVVHLKARPTDCVAYHLHAVGSTLVRRLVDAPELLRIRHDGQDDKYAPCKRTVFHNAERLCSESSISGRKICPTSVLLAHELCHALRHADNHIGCPYDPSLRTIEEDWAVRGENQVRREQCEPYRTSYGGREVPNHLSTFVSPAFAPNCLSLNALEWVRMAKLGWTCEQLRADRQAGLTGSTLKAWNPERYRAVTADAAELSSVVDMALNRRELLAPPFLRSLDEEKSTDPVDLDGVRSGFLLEAIGIDGGLSYIAVVQTNGSRTLVTNWPVRAPRGSLIWFDPPAVPQIVVEFSETEVEMPTLAGFDSGTEGEVDVLDGTLQLLTTWNQGQRRVAALYGYEFEGVNEDAVEPAEPHDIGRYRAIESIYAWWRNWALPRLGVD